MCEDNNEMTFGLGCTPSIIDGTERVLKVDDKIPMPQSYNWQLVMPPVRNQGSSSTCVCQSLTGLLDFYTNLREGVVNVCNNYSINELYSQRANKNADGMTFKEAFHYIRHHGLNGEKINGYGKVNSSDVAKYAIVMFGPIVCGLPVYDFKSKYFWKNNGERNKGGHAVTIVGFDEDGFIIRNSWGTGWGDKGHAKMSYSDYAKSCFECWTVMP